MKVIDSSLFFNEFDCLEIRLHELADVVDQFVVLESTRTFTNRSKPLHLMESGRAGKARIVVLDDFRDVDTSDPWAMEHYHRNYLMDHVRDMGADWILQSDADEIPTAEAVANLEKVSAPAVAFEQTCCYYYADCVQHVPWFGTHAMRPNLDMGGQQLRDFRGATLPNAGAHLSYLGDVPEKLAAFAHKELNRAPFNGQDHIARCRSDCLDLFGRRGFEIERVSDISYLPAYLLREKHRYRHLFHPAGEHAGDHDPGGV